MGGEHGDSGGGGSNTGKIVLWVLVSVLLLTALCCGGIWVVGRNLIDQVSINTPTVQGSGVAMTETRSVPSFSKIDCGGAMRVIVTIGEPLSVTVSGDDNLVPHMSTEVVEGELWIDCDVSYSKSLPLTVTITMPELKGITLDGAGRMSVQGLSGTVLEVDLSGASNLDVSGAVERLDVIAEGASRADLSGLVSRDAKVEADGAANVNVHAANSLDIDASGAARVRHSGAAVPKVTKSGAASTQRDE